MKKRIFAALAAMMLLGTAMTAPASAETTYQKGDVNMDGVITAEDAQLALIEYAEELVYKHHLTEEQQQLGNVDHLISVRKAPYFSPELGEFEMQVDVLDAWYILQYYVAKDVNKTVDTSLAIEDFIADIDNYLKG